MPAITVQSLEMTEEQKEILAKEFTGMFSKVTHVPEEMIYVFFDGYPLDCAAKGGIVFSKNPPKVGVGKFSQS